MRYSSTVTGITTRYSFTATIPPLNSSSSPSYHASAATPGPEPLAAAAWSGASLSYHKFTVTGSDVAAARSRAARRLQV
eukprot:272366-Hanusia_phi.AAC.1